MLGPLKKQEAYIIPPDPAIVEGQLEPGDRADDYPDATDSFEMRHALTIPLSDREKHLVDDAEIATPSGSPATTSPELAHSVSEPTRPNHNGRSHSIHSTTIHDRYAYNPPHAHADNV